MLLFKDLWRLLFRLHLPLPTVTALLLVAGFQLAGSQAHAQPITTLNDQTPSLQLNAASLMWIDTAGQSSIDQLTDSKAALLFVPSRADTIYDLGKQAVLWQRYRFKRAPDSRPNWVLAFPQPLLDKVTVYQSNSAGGWSSQSAGDTVPVASWPEPGRYAQFQLQLPDAGVRDVYVRIQNVTRLTLPVRVSMRSVQSQILQEEYLVAGVVFGALLLLIVACVVQSWVYRDRAYGWYAFYSFILMLFLASWTGVAGHLLWNSANHWNDTAPGVLGILSGATALLVIHHLCGVGSHYRWYESLTYAIGAGGMPVALAYSLVERSIGVPMVALYVTAVVITAMTRCWITWRRHDVIGLWLMAAFTPMAVPTMLIVVTILGFISSSAITQYGIVVGLMAEVPLLLIALNLRSRERHSMEARAYALAGQDALTGLLSAHIFHDRFKQVLARFRRQKEPAAVLYIELVNYRYIKKNWGAAVAEQSLLRSVIKLRRILRDVDTVGRVDEARFGLILEGESSRQPVTELAARLIAAGLMPLKGLQPEVILQFHIAAAMLGENHGSELEITAALADLIRHMGPRSRRPIRFLEPELTRPVPIESGSKPVSASPTA